MVKWSYTSLSTFELCPFKYREKYITKTVPPADSEAMRNGREIHETLEVAIKGPAAVATIGHRVASIGVGNLPPIVARLRGAGARAELALGVKADWTPCDFFDPDVAGRGKLDVALIDGDTAFILDWKTGKVTNKKYQTDAEIALHAVLLKAHYPELTRITGTYCYTRDGSFTGGKPDGRPDPGPRELADLSNTAAVRWRIGSTVAAIEMALAKDKFTTRKNNLCPWCEVTTCKHYKPRET